MVLKVVVVQLSLVVFVHCYWASNINLLVVTVVVVLVVMVFLVLLDRLVVMKAVRSVISSPQLLFQAKKKGHQYICVNSIF